MNGGHKFELKRTRDIERSFVKPFPLSLGNSEGENISMSSSMPNKSFQPTRYSTLRVLALAADLVR
jgi:hypothetical protein